MRRLLEQKASQLAAALTLMLGLSGLAAAQAGVGVSLPITPAEPAEALELIAADPRPAQIQLSSAPKGAPDIVVVLLDDVGFGATSTFGGPVETPALERLAKQGLRYNRFHTTAICSPTRASLLTGRNPHAVGWARTAEVPADYPGYNHQIPRSAATVAEILRLHGYGTSLWGKWHLTPLWETSPIGPFDRWPTSMGFEKFYGFLGGETHHFEPKLYDGTVSVKRPDRPDYHLTEDLAEQAIAWMRLQNTLAPEKPLFVYFSTGANHAPLHAPKEWIARYRGQFDQGWDKLREETFARQKQLGVIPADAKLTPRPEQLPAWEQMSPARQKIAARLMETYAGMLSHTDAQVGRLLDALDDMGRLDNTLFFYIVGDNGGSGEGSPTGTLNEHGILQGITESDAQGLERLDDIGSRSTFAQYPAGFAWATNTPFQWTKQIAAHFGGSRNPLVVSWPQRIQDRGGLRSQFSHVNSIMPTILEAVGIPAPSEVHGVQQQPIDGVSLVYTFDDPAAAERHRTQYFEIMGNRGIYHDGWMASANRGRAPWDVARPFNKSLREDRWELYHIAKDFSQAHDLAAAQPQKLREMQELFWAEAARNQVLPLQGTIKPMGSLYPAERTTFTFYPGAVDIPGALAPSVVNRSHSLHAELVIPESGAEGVLLAQGGEVSGYALFVDQQGRLSYAYNLFGIERSVIAADTKLGPGKAKVRADIDVDPAGQGFGKRSVVKLFVNDQLLAEGQLERTVPFYYSIDETFDVGTDTGSPVGPYPVDYSFTGGLQSVTVELR